MNAYTTIKSPQDNAKGQIIIEIAKMRDDIEKVKDDIEDVKKVIRGLELQLLL